jgi:hypothetical protein
MLHALLALLRIWGPDLAHFLPYTTRREMGTALSGKWSGKGIANPCCHQSIMCRSVLKARGLYANDELVRENRALAADGILQELETAEGLEDLLNAIPSILEHEKFPVEDETDVDPSATNVATFKRYLQDFASSNRYAGEVMLRPLLRHHGLSATIIDVDGEGSIKGIYESGDGGALRTRIFLVRILSGEPNEHFAALIPRWSPSRDASKRASKASAPRPEPQVKLKRGTGGRKTRPVSESAMQFPSFLADLGRGVVVWYVERAEGAASKRNSDEGSGQCRQQKSGRAQWGHEKEQVEINPLLRGMFFGNF